MKDFECTERCKQDRARAEQLRQGWREKWPNYCTRCEGWGGFWYSYDPSPAGVSLSPGSLEDFDPCPECYELGICPRCGERGFKGEEEYEGPCQKCGWDFSIDSGLPAEAECWCWERQPPDPRDLSACEHLDDAWEEELY